MASGGACVVIIGFTIESTAGLVQWCQYWYVTSGPTVGPLEPVLGPVLRSEVLHVLEMEEAADRDRLAAGLLGNLVLAGRLGGWLAAVGVAGLRPPRL